MRIGRPREVVEVTPKRVPYEGEEVKSPKRKKKEPATPVPAKEK